MEYFARAFSRSVTEEVGGGGGGCLSKGREIGESIQLAM